MEKSFLPIGTVLKLKGSKKRLMITGFFPIENDKTEENKKMWDYSGCLYPEGIISSKNNFLFNHDQIDEVQFMGFVDEEEKRFEETMKKAIEKLYNN